ncbi:MAG: PhoH family protein [Salaquimonas sp.]|nr:PhoH family protein [Salaquimonas sp.]
MNAYEQGLKARSGASDLEHLVLTFDNNRLATQLFGQFDEHLAMIEQQLGIDAVARGNMIDIRGSAEAVRRARLALEHLYARLEAGEKIEKGDVDGAIRMALAEDQLPLPTLEKGGRLAMAQIGTRKKAIQARTPTQDAYIRAMDRCQLVFGVGPAGTGKTYLAVAYAAALLERGAVDRIILSRPAVEAGERLGFLPGDMKEKVDPYLRPLYDALYDMIPGEKVERAITSGVIEIAPLAFMRGRTLSNAAVILDEAQNTTSMQMKMFLTRLGENSRMIVTGDPSQIDLPPGQKSGLVEALSILDVVEGVSRIEFTASDVVRHKLVEAIVNAYDEAGRKASEGRRRD